MLFTVLAVFITIFRLTARKFRRWWWDDLFAFVGLVAITILLLCASHRWVPAQAAASRRRVRIALRLLYDF